MKNIITINAENNYMCDLVSTVDTGENLIFIEIISDISKNPKIEIGNDQIEITSNPFSYEVQAAKYIGEGTLQFRIIDDSHVGNYFNITKIADTDGEMFLNQLDNFNYKLIISKPNTTGVPIATDKTLGVVKGGSNVGIRSDGQMYAEQQGVEKVTNSEIDEICV